MPCSRVIPGTHRSKERDTDVRAEQGARGLPQGRPGVRRGGGRAAHRDVGPGAPLPGRPGPQDGRARAVRPGRAGGVRRHGRRRRLHQPLRRDRGARPGRPVDRHHALRRRRARHQPDPDLRFRGAEAALPPGPRGGPGARGLRADRAGRRLGRRGHPHEGGPRRRRVGHQRLQGLHHQLRHRHHLGRHGHRPHRHPRGRLGPAQRDHGPERHARLHRRARLRQARLARLRHPRPDLRGLPRPGREPAGPGGARLQAVPQDPRRRPHRHLRARRRPVAADARGDHRLRQDPEGLREADRRQPGRLLPGRRPRRHGRGLPPADLQGRLAQGRARARPAFGRGGQAGRGHLQALLHRGRRLGDPHRHAGLRRQRLHGGVPRRAVLPRRQDPRDRRGHLGGAAHGHRAPASACRARERPGARGYARDVDEWHE